MKRLIILFLLIFTSIAHAQGDTAPWPPDPSDIFAEGVEIVDVIIREHATSNTSPQLDNEARVIRVFDYATQAWTEFPYPDGVENFQYVRSWGENSLLVYQETAPSGDPIAEDAYILNTHTGTVEPAQEHCGVVPPPRDENNWIFITDLESGGLILCNTFTDETTMPLPEDITPIMGMWYPVPARASENRIYIAFVGQDSQTPDWHITGYSYNRETGATVRLGDFRPDDYPRVGGWSVNDIAVFYTDGMPEWSVCRVYIAQAAVENSLKFAISNIRYCPAFEEDDRIHLVAISDGDNSEFVFGTCSRTEYNILTGETTYFDYDGLCWADYEREDGISYHRRVPYDLLERDRATLVRYNPDTREQVELYEGEIEWVSWVSEDDHYAALVLDNSGYIDVVPGSDSQWWWIRGGGTLALVDLTTEHIIYQIHAGWTSNMASGWATSYIQRLSENELFTLEAVPASMGYTYRALSVSLTDEGIVETEIVDRIIYELHSDPKRFLIWSDEDTTAGALTYGTFIFNAEITAAVSLYDMETDTITPIVANVDTEDYQLVLTREIDAENLVFTVRPRIITAEGYHRVDDSRSVTYTIRLP